MILKEFCRGINSPTKTWILIFIFFLLLDVLATDGYKFRFGGDGIDICSEIVVHDDGKFAVSGKSTSWGSNEGSYDILIAKFHQNGSIIFINSFGSSIEDTVNDMIVSNLDGNYIFTGGYEFGGGLYDPSVFKVSSSDGSVIWKTIMDLNSFVFHSIVESSNGYLAGFGQYVFDYTILVAEFNSSTGDQTFGSNLFYGTGTNNGATKAITLDGEDIYFVGFDDSFENPSKMDPVFGKFQFSGICDGCFTPPDFYYRLSPLNTYEEPSSFIFSSTNRLVFTGSDLDDNCVIIYSTTIPPETVDPVGMKICHTKDELYGLDLVESSDGNFLIVGYTIVSSVEYGLMIKVNESCDVVHFAKYFSDVKRFNRVRSTPSSRILVVGSSYENDECVVVRLEEGEEYPCSDEDPFIVDISGDLVTSDEVTRAPINDESASLTVFEAATISVDGVTYVEVAEPVLATNFSCWSCFDIQSTNESSVCSGHGVCDVIDQCDCGGEESVYYGEEFEIPRICFGFNSSSPSVCSSHGDCLLSDVCDCYEKYYGEKCNITECYGVLMNESLSCGSHGDCVALDECLCENDFYGDFCNITTCFGILGNDSSVCSGYGECGDLPDTCVCDLDYYGLNCNVTECFGILSNHTNSVCSGNGHCWPFDICTCEDDINFQPYFCEQVVFVTSCVGISSQDSNEVVISGTLYSSLDGIHQKSLNNFLLSRDLIPDDDDDQFNHVENKIGMLFGTTSNQDFLKSSYQLSNGDIFLVAVTMEGYYTYNKIRPDSGELLFTLELEDHEFTRSIESVIEDLNNKDIVLYGTVNNGFHFTRLVSFGLYVADLGYSTLVHHEEAKMALVDKEGLFIYSVGKTTHWDHSTVVMKNHLSNFTMEWVYSISSGSDIQPVKSSLNEAGNVLVVVEGSTSDFCLRISVMDLSIFQLHTFHLCRDGSQMFATDIAESVTSHYGDDGSSVFVIIGYEIQSSNNRNYGFIIYFDSGSLTFDRYIRTYSVESENRFKSVEILKDDSLMYVLYEERESGEDGQVRCGFVEILVDSIENCELALDNVPVSSLNISSLNVSDVFLERTSDFFSYSTNENPSRISRYDFTTISDDDDTLVMNFTNQNSSSVCGEFLSCFGIDDYRAEVCSGHGSCLDEDSCTCFENYTVADDCSFFYCYGVGNNETENVCSSRGLCTSYDVCVCQNGYFGNDCGEWTCISHNSTDSDSVVCSGNGTCPSVDTCVCNEGYFGEECDNYGCFGILHDNSSFVCSNHGDCVQANTCDCDDDYESYDCSFWKCFGIGHNESDVCSGHGNCVNSDDCLCENHYNSTLNCSLFYCNHTLYSETDVCSDHGNCTAHDSCECEENHYGKFCELYSTSFSCFGIFKNQTDEVCSSRGRCLSPDHCDCDEGYFGADCSLYLCFGVLYNDSSSVCNGHGDCESVDVCSCEIGYGELDVLHCDPTFSCFGVLESNLSHVCGGNGNCTSLDTCQCSEGYNDPDCETWNCFGVLNVLDDFVCSSHGECVEPDSCICDTNSYEGDDCEKWKCFNVSVNLPEAVCSSHGTCLDIDHCYCFELYNGSNCEDWSCGGYNHTDFRNCHQRGSCVSPDVCECVGGYQGLLCETWTCGGIDYKHSQTCFGRGVCLSPEYCFCNLTTPQENDFYGFFGDVCEVKLGRRIIRATRNVLVSLLEVTENNIMTQVSATTGDNDLVLMNQLFPCSYLFNISVEGDDNNNNPSGEILQEVFESSICEFSNMIEFHENVGSSVYLKIYLSSDSQDGDNNNIEEVFGGDSFSMNVVFSSGYEQLWYYENVLESNEDYEIFTIQSFLVESDDLEDNLQTCKSRLHVEDQCFSLYECIPSPYNNNNNQITRGDQEEDDDEEEEINYTYYSIGYMLDDTRPDSLGLYSKFYFEDLKSCEDGSFQNFLFFSPQRCYGSIFQDSFIVYPKCSSDVFSVLSDFSVIQIFLFASTPLIFFVVCLVCFMVCCGGNFFLYFSRGVMRSLGIYPNKPKNERMKFYHDDSTDVESEDEKIDESEKIELDTIVRTRQQLQKERNDHGLDRIFNMTPSSMNSEYSDEKIEDVDDDEKDFRRIETGDGLYRTMRHVDSVDTRIKNEADDSEMSLNEGGGSITEYSTSSESGEEQEEKEDRKPVNIVNYQTDDSSTSLLEEEDENNNNNNNKEEEDFSPSSALLDYVKTRRKKRKSGKLEHDDDEDIAEDDFIIRPKKSSMRIISTTVEKVMKKIKMLRPNSSENENNNTVPGTFDMIWDPADLKEISWLRCIFRRVFCCCCPVCYHKEIVKVCIMISTVLIFEGLNLWFASSEFLDTEDVDRFNKDYITVILVMKLSQYVIAGMIFIYLILLFFILIFGIGCRFLRTPFLFAIGYGNLRENMFFRIFKVSFLFAFFCINMFCYVTKFVFQGSEERRISLLTPNFWFSVTIPQFLLVYSITKVLSYNGSSSRGIVKNIKKRLRICSIPNSFRKNASKSDSHFPRMNIGFSKIFTDTDTMLDEILQMLSLVDRYLVKRSIEGLNEERVRNLIDIREFRKSEEFGHLDWEVLKNLTYSDVAIIKRVFFPKDLKKRDYLGYFCSERMISYRWYLSLLFFPIICMCCWNSTIL